VAHLCVLQLVRNSGLSVLLALVPALLQQLLGRLWLAWRGHHPADVVLPQASRRRL
jgi:hypothetical protein